MACWESHITCRAPFTVSIFNKKPIETDINTEIYRQTDRQIDNHFQHSPTGDPHAGESKML